ncbi:MAG TPA: urease accessory protein UreD [Marinagarivorans sp.]
MTAQCTPLQQKPRSWKASLALEFALREQVTRIVANRHCGPLRVLKPFYPEPLCCHTYLLHPPGGLVLGDELSIDIWVNKGAHALITTPSAGKVYGVERAKEKQLQTVTLSAGASACLEWLPQETLIFNGANTVLSTEAHLAGDANLALWDVVCFGRPASGLDFISGRCVQSIRIFRDGVPLLIERNVVDGGGDLQRCHWGLGGANSMGTFVLTVSSEREQRQNWIEALQLRFGGQWGITQKGELCITRYLGDSASRCRQGFEWLWHLLRTQLNGKTAVAPRIWAT